MLSTKSKIVIARVLLVPVITLRSLLGLPNKVVTSRKGLVWSLDLKEGIDLAIYILGGFEVRTLRQYKRLINEGDVVLDIGANIGSHTLPLAELVGLTGKVYSFEPTTYAFEKQHMNIALNPLLISRISSHQIMLTSTDSDFLPEAIYSSWPLESAEDLHGVHHGRLMGTKGCMTSSLDSFVLDTNIERIDVIKLDVDGNECDVLAGAKNVLIKWKPKIMLELAPHVYDSSPQKFDQLLTDLWAMGYQLSNMSTGRSLPEDSTAVRSIIPKAGSLNALAVAR
jgi:FkbM family methyltransferase